MYRWYRSRRPASTASRCCAKNRSAFDSCSAENICVVVSSSSSPESSCWTQLSAGRRVVSSRIWGHILSTEYFIFDVYSRHIRHIFAKGEYFRYSRIFVYIRSRTDIQKYSKIFGQYSLIFIAPHRRTSTDWPCTNTNEYERINTNTTEYTDASRPLRIYCEYGEWAAISPA